MFINDGKEVPEGFTIIHGAIKQGLGITFDAGQRCPQFMAHIGHKVPLDGLDPFLLGHIVKKSDEPGDTLFRKVEEANLQDLSAPPLDSDFYRQMIRRQEDLFNRTQKDRIFDDITDIEISLSPFCRLDNRLRDREGILKKGIHVQDMLPGIEDKNPEDRKSTRLN